MISTLLTGGNEIGAATLTNFYALHTGILPFFLFCLAVCHFWLIRKARGLVQRQSRQSQAVSVAVVPNLIIREAAVGLCLVAAVLLFSALVDAPLSEAATPGVSPNPAKAAWFFLGLQELLMHLHPVFAICVVPGIVVLGVAVIPYWKESSLPEGVWFGGNRGRNLAIIASVTSVVLTVAAVLIDDFIIHTIRASAADIYSRGILPLVGLLVWYILGYFILTKRFRYNRGEAVMAGFLYMVMALVSLTIIGIWFRGAGMQLVLPLK